MKNSGTQAITPRVPSLQERRSIAELIISGTPIVREIGSSIGQAIFRKGFYSSGLLWAFEQGNS